MHKFKIKKTKRNFSYLYAIITFLIVVTAIIPAINSVSYNTTVQQQKSLESALQRGIIECYALEGSYPESLQYLEEHYGVIYNKKQFFVDYQPIAENIMPNVTVIKR